MNRERNEPGRLLALATALGLSVGVAPQALLAQAKIPPSDTTTHAKITPKTVHTAAKMTVKDGVAGTPSTECCNGKHLTAGALSGRHPNADVVTEKIDATSKRDLDFVIKGNNGDALTIKQKRAGVEKAPVAKVKRPPSDSSMKP